MATAFALCWQTFHPATSSLLMEIGRYFSDAVWHPSMGHFESSLANLAPVSLKGSIQLNKLDGTCSVVRGRVQSSENLCA